MEEALKDLFIAEDGEAAIRGHLIAAIERCRSAARPIRDPKAPLRLLLVGYAGAGNIGADIRLAETARVLRDALGPKVEIGYTTRAETTAPVPDATPEISDRYFPEFLEHVIARYDAVIVCEGSVFKSSFSNTFAAMLAGALGMATAQGKPAIAFGVEAGAMDPDLEAFVRETCKGALIIARSSASRDLVEGLGLRTTLGADTAWEFEAAPSQESADALRTYGWQGARYVSVCPVNPFWWPVKPDILRALSSAEDDPDRYQSIFFHQRSDADEAAFNTYIGALAKAVSHHAQASGATPVIVGMERLDHEACMRLRDALGGAPVVMGHEIGAARTVGILRQSGTVVTSRYHGAVMAIPGGMPVIGITLDERLVNLFAEMGCPENVLASGSADLADALAARLAQARPAENLNVFLTNQSARMAQMVETLTAEIVRIHPDISTPAEIA